MPLTLAYRCPQLVGEHVVVEGDASAVGQTLEEGGMEVRDEREVLVIDVDDTEGGLGRAMRRFADARQAALSLCCAVRRPASGLRPRCCLARL